jgi:hypothetical protein
MSPLLFAMYKKQVYMVVISWNEPYVTGTSICIEFFFTEHLATSIQAGELYGRFLPGVHAACHHELPVGDKDHVLQVIAVAANALLHQYIAQLIDAVKLCTGEKGKFGIAHTQQLPVVMRGVVGFAQYLLECLRMQALQKNNAQKNQE